MNPSQLALFSSGYHKGWKCLTGIRRGLVTVSPALWPFHLPDIGFTKIEPAIGYRMRGFTRLARLLENKLCLRSTTMIIAGAAWTPSIGCATRPGKRQRAAWYISEQ